jgi:hypothetical protein
MSLKVNSWISGIHLHDYVTDQPNGTLMGFDVDFGYMYAYDGKLISEDELTYILKQLEWEEEWAKTDEL